MTNLSCCQPKTLTDKKKTRIQHCFCLQLKILSSELLFRGPKRAAILAHGNLLNSVNRSGEHKRAQTHRKCLLFDSVQIPLKQSAKRALDLGDTEDKRLRIHLLTLPFVESSSAGHNCVQKKFLLTHQKLRSYPFPKAL